MRSLSGMPCSKVVILNCFTRQIQSQSPSFSAFKAHGSIKISINLRIARHIRNSFTFTGKQKSFSTSWSFESRPRDWKSNGVRALASSREVSEESGSFDEGESGKNGAVVDEVYGKELFTRAAEKLEDKLTKPEIFTADELHYVAVPGTNWRLALWRYHPPPNRPKRNHPVLMLSGIGTNAVGFDLDPSVSMARYMADSGFETWILEVRGAGLSKSDDELAKEGKEVSGTSNGGLVENKDTPVLGETDPSTKCSSEPISKEETVEEVVAVSLDTEKGGEAWTTTTQLSESIAKLSKKLSKLLSDRESKTLATRFIVSISSLLEDTTLSKGIIGLRERLTSLLEGQQSSSSIVTQIADLRKRLAQLLVDGQDAVSPRVTDLQERLSSAVDDFQKIVDLIAKYDWDFDNYLNEDVPAAMEYILNQSQPVDGKILGVGHSMGGIVLYALLSTRGNQSGLAGAVALASALDYQCSDTSLKLLLPLTDPAQVLNVPVVPLGALMAAVHPLVTRAPYALAWLGHQVSAHDMMKPELFSKLVLNNFGTIPVKLLLHLISVFQPGGLTNRDGSIKYKENIVKVSVPVLAIAADRDLICPPVAVLDTVDLFPKETVTYKCFGGENDIHYGHYDVVCSPAAKKEIFPVILDFLLQNDVVKTDDKEKMEAKV